jgi:hypothetical protein
MARRTGSRSPGEFPHAVVRIDCERCGRAGRYALAGLIERFGADAAGPDVLMELAQCERRRAYSRPCGARFPDLSPPPPAAGSPRYSSRPAPPQRRQPVRHRVLKLDSALPIRVDGPLPWVGQPDRRLTKYCQMTVNVAFGLGGG